MTEDKYDEMVADQMVKLRAEKADRARNGAATPPSPAQPPEPVDTRQVSSFSPSLLWERRVVQISNCFHLPLLLTSKCMNRDHG